MDEMYDLNSIQIKWREAIAPIQMSHTLDDPTDDSNNLIYGMFGTMKEDKYASLT